jgi:haloacetate dehalogenase
MASLFTPGKLKVADCTIDFEIGGNGPPLLLLHGFPETKFAWHKIAPQLSDNFTLILPDLPGYGDSIGPPPDADYKNYSKRNMGEILSKLMVELGFSTYAVAGHDRGARVAYRMALDHQTAITQLVILNITPTLEMMERLDYDRALKMENWLFLAQPAPLPETLIGTNARFYLNHVLDDWSSKPEDISAEARSIYLRCFKKPEVIRSICAEYRASSIDAVHDRENRDKKQHIKCPVLVLWSALDYPSGPGDPLHIWKRWADDVSGSAIDCGHFLMEEKPVEVVLHILNFFRIDSGP